MVGHTLAPCTETVQECRVQECHRVPHPKRQRHVYFVDTPGFNHPQKHDRDILNEIANWLKKKCEFYFDAYDQS
jgi:GTPase Era involved in 16S rRNA processing